MIVFRLADKLGFSYTKEHSFGDKSIPPDFICLHVGFLRIITPIREEAFSKYFRMYIGDDYEWHHKVRKEVKKQRSKLTAYYQQRDGEQIEDYQKRNRELQDQVYDLKDDVRALVRAAEVIELQKANTQANDLPSAKTQDASNATANSLANTFANTDANDLSNAEGNADPITKANEEANGIPIGVTNTVANDLSNEDVNRALDKTSLEPARVVPSDAVNDLPMQQP